MAKLASWLMLTIAFGASGGGTDKKVTTMIHYLYATRGGYLYLVGRYNSQPKAENEGEFVLSVPDKTSQAAIDSQAHKRFMDHLRRPRRGNHHHHHHQAATV